jgi:8-oxo-dGTP pyrophosphatase MutT (NUDIX family)
MSERFTPNAAAHTLVIKDDSILMLRRFNTGWMDGLYTTPTGHIEQGESATEAAARELHEETGLSVDPTTLEHAITVHRQNESKGVYFDNYFIAYQYSGEPHIAEPDKSDDVEWLPLATLGDSVVPTVLRAIKNFQAGKRYAEDGWDY